MSFTTKEESLVEIKEKVDFLPIESTKIEVKEKYNFLSVESNNRLLYNKTIAQKSSDVRHICINCGKLKHHYIKEVCQARYYRQKRRA